MELTENNNELVIYWPDIPSAYQNLYDSHKVLGMYDILHNYYGASISHELTVSRIIFKSNSDYIKFMLEWS